MNPTVFWKINKRWKPEINGRRLTEFLQTVGYAKYFTEENKTAKPIIVLKKGSVIEESIPIRIHENVVSLLESGIFPEESLKSFEMEDLITELIKTRFVQKEEILVDLPELDKPILSDTKDTAYFPYRNKIVKVTAHEIEAMHYMNFDMYIWKNQIIDRNFKLFDEEFAMDISNYYRFLRNISCNGIKNEMEHSDERYLSLLTLIGYLLHTFKDPTNPRAVILMDASENGEANGRTGKGLFVESLSKIRKTIKEDGKSYDDTNRFKFANVTIDTNILFLDDVKERFNFENFFSVITEGITVEPKFINPFRIPFEKSPKVVISTNYALLGRGSSHEARKYEYELANYYNDKHTPMKEFKQIFFTGWNKYEWMAFDSLMMYAVNRYLKHGVVEVEPIRREHKKLIVETSSVFIDWISSFELKTDTRLNKKVLYDEYCGFCEGAPDCDIRVFVNRLKIYAGYQGMQPEETHSGNDRYIEFKLC